MSNRGTILLIEDDFAVGDLIIDALSDEGYAVHVVSDAAQLRGALSTRLPDLVLCDLHLGGLSGDDLLAHVQQIVPSNVPIVLMTADTQAASQLDIPGIAARLVKPFDLDALLACVSVNRRPRAALP